MGLTDITFQEDTFDPNRALFGPGIPRLSSSSDPLSNDVAEGDNRGLSDVNHGEEAKEEELDLELKRELPR